MQNKNLFKKPIIDYSNLPGRENLAFQMIKGDLFYAMISTKNIIKTTDIRVENPMINLNAFFSLYKLPEI